MAKEKAKTGIPGLDHMLDGGLIPGRPYVVSGTPGTGKTAVAMKFLLEGATAGEQVLYVAIDEPPNEVKRNMSSFGWDISAIHVFDATSDILSYDKTPVRDVSTERRAVLFKSVGQSIRRTSEKGPADITVNTVQEILKQEMRVRRYSRIVVDSVTSLKMFYIRTSEEYLTLQSFFRLLSDLGTTTILTAHIPEDSRPGAECHMARGEIRLHKWFDGKGLVRGVTVEKLRGSSHDHSMRPLRLSNEGVSIKPGPQKKRAEHKTPEAEGEVKSLEVPKVDRVEPRHAHHAASKHDAPQPPEPPVPEPEPPPPDDLNGQGGAPGR